MLIQGSHFHLHLLRVRLLPRPACPTSLVKDRAQGAGLARRQACMIRHPSTSCGATDEDVESLEDCMDELPPEYSDLLVCRTIGCGQFGRVKLARHRYSEKTYALKIMDKTTIMQMGQAEHVRNEKAAMEEVHHSAFTVNLYRAFQSHAKLVFALELVPGGELFSYLEAKGTLRDSVACFYAANVVLALEHMHSKGIVYRDLKPENLLIDKDGYLKVADFGFSKRVATRTFTLCGTPDYQAPEIITRKGHDNAVDYWALGVVVYEMLVGKNPFRRSDSDSLRAIFRRVLDCKYKIPTHVSKNASDLIWNLLQTTPSRRLGYGCDGWRDVKRHRWFAQIDWAKLERKEVPAPWVPSLKDNGDVRYFERYDEEEDEGVADGADLGEWPGWDTI